MNKKFSLLIGTIALSTLAMAQKGGTDVPPPPPPVMADEIAPPAPKEAAHPAIKRMHWSESGRKLHVEYKNGKNETYSLDSG